MSGEGSILESRSSGFTSGLDRHWQRYQCGFPGQRTFDALAFSDLASSLPLSRAPRFCCAKAYLARVPAARFSGDETGEFTIDLLLIGTVADAADEKVGTIADEQSIGLTPLHKFEVIRFHVRISRTADLTSFSW